MSKKKPILSMSLLASNRKDTTKKCLDSLKMIMDRLECELIIVDTGCDEEMQALLREYTDQVIPFTWCNDFSKARNAGLEKCSGEWFLFIDDDEWFENVDEIVDFFHSGEYREYMQANYIVRNYQDLEGKMYTDSWASRMIQLQPETKFYSSIHEYLGPYNGKTKLLHSYVHHYGYVFKSQEAKYRHSKRNISLLVDMIEKERMNLRWWVQLAQEYSGVHEYGKLKDLCVEGINLVCKVDEIYVNSQRGVFYSGKLSSELATFQLEEAQMDFEEFIKDKRNPPVCRGMLFSQGTEIYFRLKNYVKAKECAQKYIIEYENWAMQEDKEEKLLKEGGIFTREAYTREVRVPVYCSLISCELREKNTTALKKYFYELGWDEDVLIGGVLISQDIMEAFSVLEYDDEFPTIVETIINRKELTDKILAYLLRVEEEGGEKYNRLLEIFAKVDSPHYYVWYMKLRYADDKNDIKCLQDAYKNLFRCVDDIFHLDKRIWDIAERRSVNLNQMFIDIEFDQWKSGVDYFCEKTTLEELREIQNVVAKAKETPDIRYDYFELKVKEAALVYGAGREQYGQLRELLMDFCESSTRFYSNIYQPFAFQGDMEFLPESCRLAVRLKQVLDSENQLQAKEMVHALEGCLGVFRSLDASIRAYVRLFGDKEEERLNQLLERKSLDQVAELLSAVGEAMEYLKTHPNPELQAGVQQHRKTVENLLEQYTGEPIQEEGTDIESISNEEWLLKMRQILLQNGFEDVR